MAKNQTQSIPTVTDEVEARTLADGLARHFQGLPLTSVQQRAVVRYERAMETRLRERLVRKVPRAEYLRRTGVTARKLKLVRERWGIDFTPPIDLWEVLRAFHDAFTEHAHMFGHGTTTNGEVSEREPTMLDRIREERLAMERQKRLQQAGKLRDAADMLRGLTMIANRLRRAGEKLQKRFGAEAREIIEHALDDAEQIIQQEFDDVRD